MPRRALLCATLATLCLSPAILMARDLSLYEQPNDKAKVVGTINTETGFVPIFTQKDGKWVKVGNPENGNTGWVKSTDLSAAAGAPGGFSFSQSMTSGGNGTPSMVIRFGKPQFLTSKQIQDYWLQNERQQAALQRDIQNLMNNFFNTQPSPWMGYPLVLPVMVVPVPQGLSYEAPVPVSGSSGTPKQKQ